MKQLYVWWNSHADCEDTCRGPLLIAEDCVGLHYEDSDRQYTYSDHGYVVLPQP